MQTIKVLTVTDLHQLRCLYAQLHVAVEAHRPDAVAVVGDFLEEIARGEEHLSLGEAASHLASLPVQHLVFTRGNHEDEDWPKFVSAWPHAQRPLIALYGTLYKVGPLALIGFPCRTGFDGHWRRSLPAEGNVVVPGAKPHRRSLPKTSEWLGPLLRAIPGEAVWLMHEPPVNVPIARSELVCTEWSRAVLRHEPHWVVCGHDHSSPMRYGGWQARLGATWVLNAGQRRDKLHYLVLAFTFMGDVLVDMRMQAHPWETEAFR